MSRLLHKMLAGLCLFSASIVTATGCVDNDSSLFIQGVLKPEAPECTVTPEPSSTVLGTGVLDTAFSFEYFAWLLVGNQMTPRGSKNELRTETARMRLNGAVVELQTPDGETIKDGEFSIPGTGLVQVTSSEDAGYGAFLATLIPASIGSTFSSRLSGAAPGSRSLIVAKVRVFGETLGGQELESADFHFPIELCYGCTVSFTLDAVDANNCCTLPGSGVSPCFPGEDVIDCRNCAASFDVCKCAG